MKVTADTNILLRAVTRDDEKQARAAARLLKQAELVAISLPCLCEFVWVLNRVYKFKRQDIAAAIEALIEAKNISTNRPAVEAGLMALHAGGDFADTLIAYEGHWLGSEEFVSFDRKAVTLLQQQGIRARLLA
jgi:predicted nucleic-acid-binding protein